MVQRDDPKRAGRGFGERGGGWARLSLAVTDEVLTEGLERLRAAFA